MPDPRSLKVGDRVRIIAVPAADLQAFASGAEYLRATVEVLRWMVGREFVVTVVDAEYSKPWIEVAGYPSPDGSSHSMAIADHDSWRLIEPG